MFSSSSTAGLCDLRPRIYARLLAHDFSNHLLTLFGGRRQEARLTAQQFGAESREHHPTRNLRGGHVCVCVWERETEREERSRDAKEARD